MKANNAAADKMSVRAIVERKTSEGESANEQRVHELAASVDSTEIGQEIVRPRGTKQLAMIALVIGAATVVSSFVVGYLAYKSSRAAVLDVVAEQNLATSRTVVKEALAMLAVSPDADVDDAPLKAVEQAWKRIVPPVEGSYLCVIRSPGKLALHSLKPKMVGTDVSHVVCERRAGREQMTVLDLLKNKSSHAGLNVNFRGIWQLAGYTYYEPLDSLVVTHIPVKKLDAQINAAALPWGISLGVMTGFLFPLALLLLHTGYRRANQQSIVAFNELDERKSQLRRHFAELELVYRASPVGLCFVDTDLRFVRVNDELAEIDGLPAEHCIGRHVRDILPDIADTIVPFYRRVIETGEPVQNIEVEKISPIDTNETRHYLASYYPVRDPGGVVIGVSTVVQDITERKRDEQKLLSIQQDLERAQAIAKLGSWTYDPALDTSHWSKELFAIFRRDPELGAPSMNEFMNSIHPEDRDLLPPVEENSQSGNRNSFEFRSNPDLGPLRYFAANVEYSNRNDRIILIGTTQDITDRVAAQAQQVEADRRELLLKEIHHRVKNNLQVISSLLFLQSSHLKDDKSMEFLRESQNRVKTIALIHEKLYRSDDLASVDFGDYVRDLWSELSQIYATNQQTVTLVVDIDNVFLQIDTAIPCGLIINELVSNALKHAFPPGQPGRIEISMKSTETGEYQLTIRDDGVGLPEGFDWRKSTSLGLKLIMDLAYQMGGQVDVNSSQGTKIEIRFMDVSHHASEVIA